MNILVKGTSGIREIGKQCVAVDEGFQVEPTNSYCNESITEQSKVVDIIEQGAQVW